MSQLGVVIIGRNEGDRLIRGLASAAPSAAHIIYVDSGSTDDSVQAAQVAGAEVVSLDMTLPFTAARARNAGFERLCEIMPEIDFVQFMDGDCELREGWSETAVQFLTEHPDVAAVCGRRRELYPEASIYNRLIDQEWDTPVGEAVACGGDVLMRAKALQDAGGYNPFLIAGEEPELCVRLRKAGWTIWRLDEEMTWHNANITKVSQWWKRCSRAGHAFAEGAALHGASPERHYVAETRRTLLWGAALPCMILIGVIITPWALLLGLAWPVKIARLIRAGFDPTQAVFLTLGNFAEARGSLGYYWGRLRGAQAQLIEYK